MKTPITDSVRSADHLIDTARRLETDRAALMEALEPFARWHCDQPHLGEADCFNCKAHKAITAARSNFPDQP